MEQQSPLPPQLDTPGDGPAPSPLAELERENAELRKELAQVLETATANERIWRHFAEIESLLFRTRELENLTRDLLREVKERFQPDQVVLLLCHPDLLERFFPDISKENEPIGEGMWILPIPLETCHALYEESSKPFMMSSQGIEGLPAFFPEEVSFIRSGVMIPLCIHEVLFGGLFLGSIDADRYQPKDGTDLLEQLGIKIALCMDNCLTYERVKDFALQDPLKGLLNLFQIRTVLERLYRKAKRLQTPLSVLLIDLNFVSAVHDHLLIRNNILKHVADLLNETLPEGESFLGRYGSDEFLVLLPDVPQEEAKEVAPYLSQIVRKSPYMHQKTAILIQALIGVGALTKGMDHPESLLDAAYIDLCRLKSGS